MNTLILIYYRKTIRVSTIIGSVLIESFFMFKSIFLRGQIDLIIGVYFCGLMIVNTFSDKQSKQLLHSCYLIKILRSVLENDLFHYAVISV